MKLSEDQTEPAASPRVTGGDFFGRQGAFFVSSTNGAPGMRSVPDHRSASATNMPMTYDDRVTLQRPAGRRFPRDVTEDRRDRRTIILLSERPVAATALNRDCVSRPICPWS